MRRRRRPLMTRGEGVLAEQVEDRNPARCRRHCSRRALVMAGRTPADVASIDDRWVIDELRNHDPGYQQTGAAALVDHLAFLQPNASDGEGQELARLMKAVQDDDTRR